MLGGIKMKVSTKGRYGLRAMADLTLNSKNEHITLKSIAQRQSISENYLEQVFSALKKAGLVNSIKGPQGGYTLSDEASNITVGKILRVLEGDLSVIAEESSRVNIVEDCLKMVVWDKINQCVDELVDSITLEDIAETYSKLAVNEAYMYFI